MSQTPGVHQGSQRPPALAFTLNNKFYHDYRKLLIFLGNSSVVHSRALADEAAYGMARQVAERLGLDTSTERTLWRDRATIELNRAVLHSFDEDGVTIIDHYAEAQHRLAWLRSRQRAHAYRPTFRAAASDAVRARQGGPARFAAPPSPDRESGLTSGIGLLGA